MLDTPGIDKAGDVDQPDHRHHNDRRQYRLREMVEKGCKKQQTCQYDKTGKNR